MSDQTNKSNSMQLSNNADALFLYKHRILSVLKKHVNTDENNELSNFINELESIEINLSSSNSEIADILEDSTSFTQHVAKTQTDERLKDLVDEIQSNEAKIHEFKISLAEAIIENRSIKIKAEEQSNSIKDLENRILYLNTHSKSASLDFMSIKKNFTDIKEENQQLALTKSRLDTLNYELKQINAENSEEIKSLRDERDKLFTDHEALLSAFKKTKKDLEYQSEHSKSINQRLAASENRESELASSVSLLQQEKNHLQMRVNNLISGLKKEVLYSKPNAQHGKAINSDLAPTYLPPYIPFCFPERLPRITLMKQEASLRIPASFNKKSFKQGYPAQFHFGTVIDLKIVNRIKKYRHTMQTTTTDAFTQSIPLFDVDLNALKMSANYHKHDASQDKFTIIFDSENKSKILCPYKFRHISLNPLKTIATSSFPNFLIEAYSISLYIAFLSNRLFQNHYFNLSRPGTLTELRKGKSNRYTNKLEVSVNKNLILEKLALRHGLHLKFKNMEFKKIFLSHSFRNQSKLKTVLKTFESAISSIVEKYDSFSPPT